MMRNIAYFLIGFAALCWLGAAWVGITNAGSGITDPGTLNVQNMFTGVATTSSLIAIALGVWFKD